MTIQTAFSRPPVIFLMGATASGKTDLALFLAEHFGFELISVDSALVYRDMDIGTAKPEHNILQKFPHALVDIRDPEDTYSAADFRSDALSAIQTIHARGKIPLLVGGTGLYFRALEYGFSDLPEANADIRQKIADQAHASGWAGLHHQLTKLDPVAAKRIHENDTQRIQRALEVIAITGRPLSAQQVGLCQRLPFRILKIVVYAENREALHARIAQRFVNMLANGFCDEVTYLKQRVGLTAVHPSMRAVGYRQVWQYLEGQITHEQMMQQGIFATRQLAKRQLTWLRNVHDAIPCVLHDIPDYKSIQHIMEHFLP